MNDLIGFLDFLGEHAAGILVLLAVFAGFLFLIGAAVAFLLHHSDEIMAVYDRYFITDEPPVEDYEDEEVEEEEEEEEDEEPVDPMAVTVSELLATLYVAGRESLGRAYMIAYCPRRSMPRRRHYFHTIRR